MTSLSSRSGEMAGVRGGVGVTAEGRDECRERDPPRQRWNAFHHMYAPSTNSIVANA